MSKDLTGKGDLASLKSLLVGDEQRSLEELDKRVAQHHERIGTEFRLQRSVAKIIAASLRDAEITQHKDLANAISPLVVAGIKREIRNSRDEMVDALYPILGRLVSAYVSAAMRKLADQTNRRLESTLTGGKLALRIKSLLTGKPYSELLLRSQPPELTEVLLIKRESGTLVDSWHASHTQEDDKTDSTLVSSLLTAITDFAREAFAESNGELRMLDTGTGRTYLRATPAYLIALHYTGQADPQLGDRVDSVLIDIMDAFDERLDPDEQPDTDSGPPILVPELAQRLSAEVEPPRRTPVLAYMLAGVLVLAAIGGSGWYAWQSHQSEQLHATVRTVLKSDPRLTGYPFDIELLDNRSRVKLSGIGPAGYEWDVLRAKLSNAISPAVLETSLKNVAVPQSLEPLRNSQQALLENIKDLKAKLGSVAQLENLNEIARNVGALSEQVDAAQEQLSNTSKVGEVQSLASLVGKLGDQLSRFETTLSGRMDERIAEQAANFDKQTQENLAPLAKREDVAAISDDVYKLRREILHPQRQLREWVRNNAIFFDRQNEFLSPNEAAAALDELALLLLKTGKTVRVIGHADITGTTQINGEIALARARLVAEELEKRDVAFGQILVIGRIDARFSVRNAWAERQRRVEFEIPFTGEPVADHGDR